MMRATGLHATRLPAFVNTVETVLVVLMLGAVTGIAARYLRAIPLPLIQIALGALISWPRQGLHIAFDPELFLLLFIPPLLFADGWRIPKREFFKLYKPILRLALGLVLVTVLGLGWLIHWMIPTMPLTVAFALAAVVSPTDAVAVSAITRNLGMPPKTMHILEGESMLNDASGLVALKFAVAFTLTGLFSWTGVAREFAWVAVGGLAVGAGLGWGFAWLRDVVTRRVGDVAATQMVMLILLLPFAAYMLGERLGVSGILAAVAAGFATNYADLQRGDFIAERMQTAGAWAMIESAFNGAIFLLLGLQLPSILASMAGSEYPGWQLAGYVLAICAALLLLRWGWLQLAVQGSLLKAHLEGKMVRGPSRLLNLASTLAGIRGAVTLAGALSVPLVMSDGRTPFPARDLLIFLATGTIIVTLVLASVGLPLILRRLPEVADPLEAREEREARLAACRAAIASLALDPDRPEARDPDWVTQYQEAVGRLTQDYRRRIGLLGDDGEGATPEARAESPEAQRQRNERYLMELELRLACLHIERDTLYAERHAHRINDESLRSLVAELDLSEISLIKRLKVARKTAEAAPPPAAADRER